MCDIIKGPKIINTEEYWTNPLVGTNWSISKSYGLTSIRPGIDASLYDAFGFRNVIIKAVAETNPSIFPVVNAISKSPFVASPVGR